MILMSIDNLFGRLLAPLDGYKTKIGSWILSAMAVNQVLPFVPSGIASTLIYAACGLIAYGLRDAIEKLASPPAANDVSAQ